MFNWDVFLWQFFSNFVLRQINKTFSIFLLLLKISIYVGLFICNFDIYITLQQLEQGTNLSPKYMT